MNWVASLVYFAVTVALAVWQRWSAADLAWSMWFASLVTGYALLVGGILGRGDWLPTLVFFSVHFVGFHFAHSQILWSFFPLGDEKPAFGGILIACARRYWPFVLVALLNLWPRLVATRRTDAKPLFEAPYKAVIRNHLTILAVALAAPLVARPHLLYILLILYFFPFDRLRALVSRGAPTRA